MKTYKINGHMILSCGIEGRGVDEEFAVVGKRMSNWYPFQPDYQYRYRESEDALVLESIERDNEDIYQARQERVKILNPDKEGVNSFYVPEIAKRNERVILFAKSLGIPTIKDKLTYDNVKDGLRELLEAYTRLIDHFTEKVTSEMTNKELTTYYRRTWEMKSVEIHKRLNEKELDTLRLFGEAFTMYGLMRKMVD